MARKLKSSISRTRSGYSENEDDTKFYIKFKDPRSKSQIFYYFDEEDIFDPCIPLNHGDIVSDSNEIPIENNKIKEKVVETKRAQAPAPIAKAPPPKAKAPPPVDLPYFEDSTLQVQTANILPPQAIKPKKSKPIPELDENFEDMGYQTAMDLNYIQDQEIEVEEEEVHQPIKKKQVIEDDIDEEPFHELEEYHEPVKKPNRNLLHLKTAIESVEEKADSEILTPISLTKEEFDKSSAPKECIEYKEWVECHLNKTSLLARQISATEFRLLKKLIGLKTK